MVRVHFGPPLQAKGRDRRNCQLGYGGLAQLGERLPCKQEVSGSIPLISTTKEIDWSKREWKLSVVSLSLLRDSEYVTPKQIKSPAKRVLIWEEKPLASEHSARKENWRDECGTCEASLDELHLENWTLKKLWCNYEKATVRKDF